MTGPKIAGDGWEAWFDESAFSWRMSGGEWAILKMIKDRFPADVIESDYMTISKAEDDRPFGPLYEDAVAFLNQWGVRASADGVSPAVSEDPPS
jgi:hypothetical protein